MTATRLLDSRIWGLSTKSGRLVSTTTSSVPGRIFTKASAGFTNTPSYSGNARSMASTDWAAFFSGSMTIWALRPSFRAAQQTPTAAPTASMSAKLWPMT